jgi:cell division protease FtsH
LNSTVKSLILWMALFVAAILLYRVLSAGQASPTEASYSRVVEEIKAGKVEGVTFKGEELGGTYKDGGGKFTAELPPGASERLIDLLEQHGVEIDAEQDRTNPLLAALLTYGPILLLVALWIFFMRQMQTGGNRALSFGKSKAKLLNTSGKKVTFKDVAGVEEAKEELQEIVEFLKEPQKFQKLGGRIPKGVLLMGPPGTGKTLLARAIAGEANVPFFSISGSDFVEMFVGVGASRVRDLFEQGKKNAPCIIFIDEIDAVGRHRGAGLGGGHDEREQTLNQLLVEMDGFESNEGVILIAATNRPDVLDPALLRPGRFDRRVVVDRPDLNGRLGILEVHTRTLPLAEDIDLRVIARGTPGFAGADLANLVNEAALVAARRDKKKVDLDDFEYAKDKIMMGVERRTLMLTEEEKRITAYHEAGHALVAAFTPGSDPLHKVTIIPRGRALGLTMQLPTEDKHNYGRAYIQAQISILMGGRVAEELTQEDITTGAGNDIERATEMARRMVCEWGMSELGPLSFGNKDEPVFLGRDFNQRSDYSEDTARKIDQEVRAIVQNGYQRAQEILRTHREVLELVARELLERESLDGEEIYRIIEETTGLDVAPLRGQGDKRGAPPTTAPPEAASEPAAVAERRPEKAVAAPPEAAPEPAAVAERRPEKAVAAPAAAAAPADGGAGDEAVEEEPEVATAHRRVAAVRPAPRAGRRGPTG